MRKHLLSVALLTLGCGYPEYEFAPSDSAAETADEVEDSVALDAFDAFDTPEAIDAADGSDASDASDGPGDSPFTCPTTGVPMRSMGTYCIDESEVTIALYQAFLTAKGSDTSGQPPECAWNTSFKPGGAWPYPSSLSKYPVVDVDWCDAYAYCKWTGKRLCGGITGGANPFNAFDDPAKSQWHRACTNGGITTLPYGSAFLAQRCNGRDFDAGPGIKYSVSDVGGPGMVPVEFAVDCHGVAKPYAEVFDMVGNVWEWEDSCDGTSGATDKCRIRGGSYVGTVLTDSCGTSQSQGRADTKWDDLGIRCCAP